MAGSAISACNQTTNHVSELASQSEGLGASMPLDKHNPAVKDDHSNEPPIRNFSSMLIDHYGDNQPAQPSSVYRHQDKQEISGTM